MPTRKAALVVALGYAGSIVLALLPPSSWSPAYRGGRDALPKP